MYERLPTKSGVFCIAEKGISKEEYGIIRCQNSNYSEKGSYGNRRRQKAVGVIDITRGL